jgi:hypothetical protein
MDSGRGNGVTSTLANFPAGCKYSPDFKFSGLQVQPAPVTAPM